MTEQVQQPFSGEEFKQKLIDAGFISANDVSGCTQAEIEQAMKWQNVSNLPQSYIEFLRWLGYVRGYCVLFFHAEEWDYSLLQKRKEYFLESVIDREFSDISVELVEHILDSGFLFANYYQSYVWYYFFTDEQTDDPPIYEYFESKGSVKVSNSFTDFLNSRYNALKNYKMRQAQKLHEKSVAATLYAHQLKPEPTPKLEKSKSLWEQIADFLGLSR